MNSLRRGGLHQSWRGGALVVAMLLAGWWLRFVVYATQELGLDGHLSVGLALLPPGDLLTFLARDVHPPLYYLALQAWLGVAGFSFAAARWPSLAAGVLTLALVYRLVAAFAGKRGGLVALLLVTLSPAAIAASATARDFSLGLLLSVASLVVWEKALRSDGARQSAPRAVPLIALAVLTALALATWYFHVLFLAVQTLDIATRRGNRRGLLLALLVGIALQAPWLVVAAPPLLAKLFSSATVSGGAPEPVQLGTFVRAVASTLGGSAPAPIPAPLGALPWALLAILGSARALTSRTPRGTALLAAAGVLIGIAAVAGLATRWSSPALLGRYVLVILPWVAVLQGLAVAPGPKPLPLSESHLVAPFPEGKREPIGWANWFPLSPWGTGLVAVFALAALTFEFFAFKQAPPIPWESEPAVAVLERAGRPDDAVVFNDHARLGLFVLRQRLAGARSAVPQDAVSIHFAGSAFLRDDVPGRAAALLGPLLEERERVWFANDWLVDRASTGEIERRLTADRFVLMQETHGTTTVKLFGRGPDPLVRAANARFGGQAELAHWEVPSVTPAGGMLFLTLRWRTLQQPTADYTVFVHLVDDRGERVAQSDGEPVLGLRPTSGWEPGEEVVDRRAIPVSRSVQPGDYELLVGLYRGAVRLPVAGSDHVKLGPVRIAAPLP